MAAPAGRGRPRTPSAASVLAGRLLSPVVIVAFVLLWGAAAGLNARLRLVNPVFFPGPLAVLDEAWRMLWSGELLTHTAASLTRVLVGFSIAMAVGVTFGTLAGRNRWVAETLEPLVSILRPIPPIALLPIMVVWLGIGDQSKVVFIAYAAFFQVFLTTYHGVRGVDVILLRAAESLGTRPWRTFWKVVLPSAMPQIVTGVRLGFSTSFFVIVAAEFIGAEAGLGYLIFAARVYFEVKQMFVAAVAIGILGFFFDFGMRKIERRLFAWRS